MSRFNLRGAKVIILAGQMPPSVNLKFIYLSDAAGVCHARSDVTLAASFIYLEKKMY